jgi:hypothetical protein
MPHELISLGPTSGNLGGGNTTGPFTSAAAKAAGQAANFTTATPSNAPLLKQKLLLLLLLNTPQAWFIPAAMGCASCVCSGATAREHQRLQLCCQLLHLLQGITN